MNKYGDKRNDLMHYMKKLSEGGRTILQVIAGRQYAGAEPTTYDDLLYAVPSKLGFFYCWQFSV